MELFHGDKEVQFCFLLDEADPRPHNEIMGIEGSRVGFIGSRDRLRRIEGRLIREQLPSRPLIYINLTPLLVAVFDGQTFSSDSKCGVDSVGFTDPCLQRGVRGARGHGRRIRHFCVHC